MFSRKIDQKLKTLLDVFFRRSDQERIDSPGPLQLLLQVSNRHEGIANRLRSGFKREARHALIGQDAPDLKAKRL